MIYFSHSFWMTLYIILEPSSIVIKMKVNGHLRQTINCGTACQKVPMVTHHSEWGMIISYTRIVIP